MGAAGAILTGGASSRMGRDKAFVEVDGVAMVERVADALRAAGVEPIAAIGGDRDRLAALGLSPVADLWPGEGPLGGVLAAFSWSPAAVLVVTSCDLPWLDAATVGSVHQALIDALGDPSAEPPDLTGPVAAVALTDRREPLCAAWLIERAEGPLREAFDRGVRSVQTALGGLQVVGVPVAALALRDVDRPEDLPQ